MRMLLIQYAEDSPSSWTSASHVADLDETPGSLLCSDPALAVIAIKGMNQWMGYFSLSVCLSFIYVPLSFKQIKSLKNLEVKLLMVLQVYFAAHTYNT